MRGVSAFRLAALAAVAAAVLVAALQPRAPRPTVEPRPAAAVAARPADPRLARCQALGAAGAEDRDCLEAWGEARARFLGARREGR